MSAKTAVSRRCIVIHGVPGDISQTSLRQEIKRQHDVNVVRIEEIQGAEANRKLKQWILELEGEQYVTQLKNRSLKLEFDDQDKTVQFLEPTECELPSSWLSRTDTETRNQEHEKMEKDEAQKIAGGPLHYQYFQSQSQQPIITRDPSTGQCYMQNASGIWLPVSDEYIQHAQYNNQPPQPPPKTSTEPVFDGSQTEILVEDIPDGVDEEILEMYFSSKTLKQCSVKDVDFNEVERNAVIRFESPEDVKRVLDNRPIKVEKMEVTVQIYVPKRLCSIIVRGPKEIMNKENKDIIEMYFENENKSKGGDIADIDFRSKEHAYYIRFKEEDVARRVVDRGGHRLKGKELTVELFTPSRSPKQAANETDMDTDDSKANHGETYSKPGKTVKVRGVKDVSDMETIEWYFGTKRKSGGGEIAKTYMDDTDPDIIYIEYTDENVANDVVDRQHNLEGHTLDVTLFDRQDHENSRAIDHDSVFAGTEILVEDIPLGIHKDLLEMCFSSGKFNACTVEYVDFDEVTRNAVIKFEKPGDVKTVLSNLPIKIKEKELSVQMYVPKQLNTIIARGPTEIMKEKHADKFEMYFEDEKKSGGGVISEIDIRPKENTVYVTFENEDVAKRVVNRGGHRFMNTNITVELLIPSRPTQSSSPGRNKIATAEDVQSKEFSTEILVENIPSGVDKDYLGMFFSSKRLSSCQVEDVDFNETEMSAVIKFRNHKDVKTVLENLPITIKKQDVSVHMYIPKKLDTIIVRGPKEVMKTNNIAKFRMYFENKKSGGGDIAECNFRPKEHALYISFYEENAAKRVANRGGHRLMNKDITVELLIPSRSTKSLASSHNTEENFQSQTETDQECLSENNSTKILVEDIPSGVDTDYLEMAFSSKKFGLCTVKDVDFNENEMNAVITFGSHEDVVIVLENLPITIKEKELSVQIFIPKTLDTIIVRGPKVVMKEENMDAFMMYFENKKSGGGDIAECNFRPQEHEFFITFAEENVAKRVVDRGGHRCMNHVISVSLHSPSRLTKASKISNFSEESKLPGCVLDEEKKNTKSVKTIKVRGVNKVSNRESVLWYFENKKAGGAEIEKRYTDDEDDDVLYIEYKDETVATSVVGRQHSIDGHPLVVTLYTPPVPQPCYTNKLLIKGLTPEIKFSVLNLFMEAKTGLSLKEDTLMYHIDQEDTVLVTVSGDINMAKLEEVSKSTPLEGSYLKFSQVPISSSVLVSNIDDFTNDTVMLYFETTKRSNGGPVKTVQMLKGYSIVDFMDYKVVDNVLSTNHKLDGREFEVRRYFPCIGRAEGDAVERRFKKPSPFKLKTDVHKMQFLTRFKAYKNEGEKRLAICHAAIDWPLHPDVNEIEISCTLSEEVKYCVKLANDWQINAAASFDDFINTYVVARVFVVHEILESVNEEVSKRKIIDIDEVMLQNEENNIYIVGKKESVININKIVQEIVKQKQEDMERKKAWSSVKIQNLKQIETKMFSVHQFPRQMEEKYPGSKVLICEEKNEIEIEGINNIVNQIQLDLYILKETFKTTNMSITNETEAIFMSSSFKQHIDKKCEEKKVLVVWEANKGKLYVMSQNEEMLKEAVEIVYKSVTTGILSLAPESMALLQSHQWKDIHQRLQSDHHGKVSIETTSDKIRLAGTDDIYNVVLQTIKDFLDTNTIYVDKWSFAKNVQEFLVQYYLQDMQDIAKSNNATFRAHTNGFEISSTKNNIQSIKTELESLAKKVQKTQHLISKPGSPDFMNSAKGQNILKSVANSHQVLIVSGEHESDDDHGIYDQDPNAVYLPSGCSVMAACTGYGTRNMYAVVCDMTDLNVDVLVNSSDDTINLHSGLGQALLSKGGSRIEKDCQKYIAAHGKLTETAVHMSTAGHLNAKCIIHVSGPQWKGGSNKEDDILTEAVFAVMREASEKGFKSLAIPAIGCGARGYPFKRATRVIVASVKNFFCEIQDSSLTEIYMCDLKEDTVKGIVEGLETVWGASNVRRVKEKHASSAIPEYIRRNSGEGTTQVTVTIGNICVSVKKAEIAEQNIPVIVNTTARNLNLNNGAVSKAISQKAGHEMQSELIKNFPTGINEGQVAVTKGYQLKCLNVIHGGLSNWNGQKTIHELKSFVHLCLRETQKLGHSGIAFPALGTGTLGYPKYVVASEMLIAVSEFTAKYPQSSLVTVNLIVYPKDVATIQAFEQAIADWPGKTRPPHIMDDDGKEDYLYQGAQGNESHAFRIDTVTITVKQGDITKEDVDCIICSSNENLDLSGKVGQTLVNICGKELMKEAQSKRGEMSAKGFAITKAPKLQCRHIMHVVAKYTTEEWKQVVSLCLRTAKAERYCRIALPALGTGMSVNVDKSAKALFQAISDFAKEGFGSLKEIRIVIFQSEMVDKYRHNAQKARGFRSTGGAHIRQLSDNANTVRLLMYSLKQSDITNAISQLTKLIEDEIKSQSFKDSIIKQMDDRQKQTIAKIAQKHSVELHHSVDGLEINGFISNVCAASNDINMMIKDAIESEHDRQSALMLKGVVQWFYIEVTNDGDNSVPFDEILNFKIEKAFTNQDDSFEYREHGLDVVVDFKTLQEYEKGETDDTKKTTIVRKNLVKDQQSETPQHWKKMKGNHLVLALPKDDLQYEEIENEFKKSGPRYIVHKIEMVQNKYLWQQYDAKKIQLEGQNPPGTQNERFLWHGTSADTVDSVNAHGFNRSYCGKNATLHGQGVYFAVDANYSCSDTYSIPDANGVKRIYYCKVLTGEYTKGAPNMRVLPTKPSGGKHALYDSATDNPNNPAMFIIFNDTQAYPLFIVHVKGP